MIINLQCNVCNSRVPTKLEHQGTYVHHEFMDKDQEQWAYSEKLDVHWIVSECVKCNTPLVAVGIEYDGPERQHSEDRAVFLQQVFPKPKAFHRLPISVPFHIRNDYQEAQDCLDVSPRAAAALCRKVLHAILIDKCSGTGANFGDDIRRAKDNKHFFGRVHELITAVQRCGNYSVHAKWNKDTLEMIETSREEAELLIEVTRDAMIHFYETVPRENQLLKRIKENSEKGVDTLPTPAED